MVTTSFKIARIQSLNFRLKEMKLRRNAVFGKMFPFMERWVLLNLSSGKTKIIICEKNNNQANGVNLQGLSWFL